MGETLTFNWALHAQQLCKGIVDLLKENFQTDFKLLVKADDKSDERQMVEVHHLVLAIFCPLLRNVTEKELDLGNYNIDDLQRLVEFLYTGKTTVNKAGVSRLRRGANAIGLKPLVNSIDTYVRRQKAAADDDDDTQASNHSSSMSDQSSGTTADDTQSEDTRPKKAESGSAQARKPASPIKSRAAKIKSLLRPSAAESPVKSRRMATLKSSRPPPTKLTCKHCSYSSTENFKMTTHMAIVHHVDAEGNKLGKNVKCAFCSFTCYSKDQLRSHRYLKHNKADQLKCEQCPYVCATGPSMKIHKRCVHSDERPLMCDHCGLRFKMPSSYNRHMRRHIGLKADCEVCGKTVARDSLKRHMELHKSDEKPFACHLCSFATKKRFNLRIHLRRAHKLDMDNQGNVLGMDETSGTSKSPAHSSAEDNSKDCAVDSHSNTD